MSDQVVRVVFAYSDKAGFVHYGSGASKRDIEKTLGHELSYDDYVAHVLKISAPEDAVNVVILAGDEPIFQDLTFRNAWEFDGDQAITVNMSKAREIHRSRLREQRGPELAKLDVDFLRSLETDDKIGKASIVAKKQRLRDAPAHIAIESAKTPDELKAITLETLTK